MDATKSRELFARGQSIWYDNISRALLNDGTIPALIRSGAIYGITTNPTIFSKAIPENAYDASIGALAKKSLAARQILDSLMVEDVQIAADLFRELYEATSYVDGYVSLEVSPELARNTEGTIKDVKRLAAFVDRPNVLFKVPGTKEGVEAIRVLTSLGYSINVTLLFDVIQYEAAANAYLKGLAEFVRNGGDARRVNSVASVFVSRI
ncbi:MAG: transaldolase family protein, partial [Candidatus Brocadiia bacterium]